MPASGLMSLAEWKKGTSLTLRKRGPRLRAVDSALNNYQNDPSSPNLLILMHAIEHYRSTREGGWENYRRNKGHIFEVLMSQLFNLASGDDTVQAMAALPFFGIESWAVEGVGGQDLADAIRVERKNRLTQLLHGRTLRCRWGAVAWQQTKILGRGGVQMNYELSRGGDGSNSGSVIDAISDSAGAVGTEFLSIVPVPKPDLAELVPVFGLIYDGLKTAWEWKQYADLVVDKGRFPGFLRACSGEAPDIRAAVVAVQSYLEKRLGSQRSLAAVQTASFAGKIATFFADGGVASHASITGVKTALKAFLTLQFAYDEFKEMKAAQKLLSAPDARIFEACPLLGCYMVTSCDHSDLLNMFDGRRELSKYWQYEAMYYIREINKLRDIARTYMKESNVELVGPESAHNTVTNKLRWLGKQTAVSLGAVSYKKELASGRALSSDAA